MIEYRRGHALVGRELELTLHLEHAAAEPEPVERLSLGSQACAPRRDVGEGVRGSNRQHGRATAVEQMHVEVPRNGCTGTDPADAVAASVEPG